MQELTSTDDTLDRAGSSAERDADGSEDVFVFPTSIGQRRFWLLDRLEPGNPAYNAPIALRITGTLDVDALGRALDEVVRRHEVLRTTIDVEDGAPVQIIAASAHVALPLVDLRGVPAAERGARAEELTHEEAVAPFDLARGPLFRARLIRVEDEEHLLLVTMHHVNSDGWSLGLLVNEIGAHYTAFVEGRPSPLPELPIQYADFAEWQKSWLESADFERQLAFWKQQIGSRVPTLDLPTDRPRRSGRPGPGAMRTLLLEPKLGAAIKALCQREDVTTFMLFFAVFNTLLHRYTGQDNVVAGTPAANRNQAETESLIGLFVNLLVLRTDLAGDPRFRDLLARVRDTALEAFAHHDFPFERLVDELAPDRERGNAPLIQVMFIYQSAFMRPIELSGATLRPDRSVSPGSVFEMTQSVVERAEGFRLQLEYNTDLYDDATAERFLEHFRTLLEAIVERPDARLSELPLLTAAERARFLPSAEPTADRPCVHDAVAAFAESQPDAVALSHEDRTLSYAELDRRANQLARHLRDAGVEKGSFVGVAVDPSPDFVVAALAALKAGGAFVPLDARVASGHLPTTLDRWGVTVAVGDGANAGRLSGWSGRVVRVDAERDAIDALDGSRFDAGVGPDDPAAVIHTSGSAGRPESAIVSHGALARHGAGVSEAYELRSADRLGRAGSVGSSALAEELAAAWTAGASLTLAPSSVRPGDGGLLAWATRERPTVLSLDTSVWYALVDELARDGAVLPDSIRLVASGGERASRGLYDAWTRRVGPDVRLLNAYRTAESVGTAAYYDPAEPDAGSWACLGRPVAGAHLCVLDAHGHPLPAGVRGDVYVDGSTLVDGYLARPELARERFPSDPQGARRFATGDVGRYRPDGRVELLGRSRDRVRTDGARADLRAVELALEAHESVRLAVVMVREDVPGVRRLVAYLVPEPRTTLAVGGLKRMLLADLPPSSVPAAFVKLDELPLTRAGKIDRLALLDLDLSDQELERPFVAPRDEVERKLAVMWENLLGVAQVGVHDSFFDLGGHSLSAARLFDQIATAFGRSLPLSIIFQRATIEHLAAVLREDATVDAWSPLVPLQPKGTRPPFYAGGSNPRYADVAAYLGDDQPFYGLDVYALQERRLELGKPLYTDIAEMATAFVEEIRAVQPEGPYYLGGGCEGGIVAFEVAHQLRALGQEIGMFVLWETRRKGFSRRKPFSALLRAATPARLLIERGLENLRATAMGGHDEVRADGDQANRNIAIRKAIATATGRYDPKHMRGKIIYLQASEQPKDFNAPSAGWGELASDGLELHVLPGNHTTYFEEHLTAFAERLKASLDRRPSPRT